VALGLGVADDARGDSPLLSRSGKTEAQTTAIAGGAASSHTERFDITPGEGAFTFDEAAAPAPAASSGARGDAHASAGTVFHASASAGADGTLAISASGRERASADVHDNDPELDNGSHFAEGLAQSFVKVSFEVTGEPQPYRITGSATGANTFAELHTSSGTPIVRIVPGQPAFGRTGTLAPGSYELEFELDVEMEAQAPGSHSATDTANGDVALLVGAKDTDGDALPDDWEASGLDTDGDGVVDLDLPAMGADPAHKDVFLELDFMPPHRISDDALRRVSDAFAAAPVPNPDGRTGIVLHADNGPGSVMDPESGVSWGSRSRQSSFVHQNVIGSVTGVDYDWSAFDALKANGFPPERRQAFRYMISAHGHDGRLSGAARGAPGSDFLVTLGEGCRFLTGSDCTLDAMAQGGTVMHELGHALGLRHGGGDDRLDKPNYLSVMNYSFQLGGLRKTDATSFLDYSRFGIGLNETALDEARGFGVTSGPAASLITVGRCPDGSRAAWPVASGPVDFNCDKTTGGAVSSDVNGDGARTALPGFVDWPALQYAGGTIGGRGAAVPETTVADEVPLEQLLPARDALAAGLPPTGGGGPAPPAAAPPTTLGRLVLSRLRLRPARFRPLRRGGPITRRGGARLSYRLSRAARVRFTIARREGRRFVKLRGAFTHAGRAGTNRLRLSGRLARRALRRGRYRLTATAVAPDGTRATPARVTFRIR
jgi:hypothetical protein